MAFSYHHLDGLMIVIGGTLGLLLAYAVVPMNPAQRGRMESWRHKHGKTMRIICPIVILFGLLVLLGFFS